MDGSFEMGNSALFNNNSEIFSVTGDVYCSVLFMRDIYIALGYDLPDCGYFTSSLQVGYEFQYWTSVPFANAGIFVPVHLDSSLGLQGLVVRLKVGF